MGPLQTAWLVELETCHIKRHQKLMAAHLQGVDHVSSMTQLNLLLCSHPHAGNMSIVLLKLQ